MDIAKIAGKIPKWFREYRYPILIVVVGLVLLTIPGRTKTTTAQPQTTVSTESSETDTATRLAQVLSQMDGVGKVQVMLTLCAGETTIYHSDEDIDTGENSSVVRRDTVVITDSDRGQKPLISQVIPEKYQGAVVVCQGADRPSVKLAVVEAVSKATGLGADQISVLKMK